MEGQGQQPQQVPPAPVQAPVAAPDPTLIAAIVAAVQAAMQNVPPPQINVNPTADSVKPGKYKGERGRDLDRFISQCDAYWVTANVIEDRKKILTALGLLEGSAAHWAIGITDFMAAQGGALPNDVSTWDQFKEQLRKFFGDATPEDSAIIELTKLCNLEPRERNARDVAAYVTEFRTLVNRISGLSGKDKEIRFTSGLPNWLYTRLATAETPPTTYDEWQERALKAYAANQRVREREAADKKSPSTPSTSRTTTTQRAPVFQPAPRPTNSGPVPMEVDASQTRQYRADTKCYNCDKVTNPPHMARECPEPPRRRRPRVAANTTATAASSSADSEEIIANMRDTIDALKKELDELKKAKEDF